MDIIFVLSFLIYFFYIYIIINMEYTDIKIIECNKRQSIGASDITGHNALFTNKLGENIMLEEGDTIEVEYSFINEKGCGSDTIEIEGKDLGVIKDFVYVVDDTLGTYRGIDIVNPTTNKPLLVIQVGRKRFKNKRHNHSIVPQPLILLPRVVVGLLN